MNKLEMIDRAALKIILDVKELKKNKYAEWITGRAQEIVEYIEQKGIEIKTYEDYIRVRKERLLEFPDAKIVDLFNSIKYDEGLSEWIAKLNKRQAELDAKRNVAKRGAK